MYQSLCSKKRSIQFNFKGRERILFYDHIMSIIILWIAIVLLAVFLYYRQIYSKFTALGLKQQRPAPFFGNMWKVLFRIEHFNEQMNSMYNEFPEERFIGNFEFAKPCLMIRDIELVKKIAIKDSEHFVDHRHFLDDNNSPIFTRGLFFLRGQEWKDMRSTLGPVFTSSKIKQMIPLMEEVGEMMIQAIKNKIINSGNTSAEIDCKDLTSRYANDVIASCAFGLKVDSHTDRDNKFYEMGKNAVTFKLKQMIVFLLTSASPFLVKVFNLRLFSKEATNFFVDLVQGNMQEREKNKTIRPDMIHLLMEVKKGRLTHDADVKSGKSDTDVGFTAVEELDVGKKTVQRVWSDTDLTAQAVLFFRAAFETISTTTSFTLYELALNKELQERLLQEIKEHNVKQGGKLDLTSIQNLTYLDMVISEALRLWPAIGFLDRLCTQDYNIGKPNSKATKDYIIRKGDIVVIPTWGFHHDSQFYSNPYKFDPERFSKEKRHLLNPIAYMPFGLGPRNCIGSRFAICELKVLLYQIILNFEVSPSEKTCIPAKLPKNSFDLDLQGGQWLQFKLR